MLTDPENGWDWDAIRKRVEDLAARRKGCNRSRGMSIEGCWCKLPDGTVAACPPGWETWRADPAPAQSEQPPFHMPATTPVPWFQR